MRAYQLAGITLCTALLSACSSFNPFSSKDPKTEPAPLQEFKPAASIKTQWTYSIGASGARSMTPALWGESVVVASADGNIARLELGSGRALWRVNLGKALSMGVGANGELGAVAGKGGALIAFDSAGKILWEIQLSTEIVTTPAVSAGMVVVRTLDNRVVALDAKTGTQRWSYERSNPSLLLRTTTGLRIVDNQVLVPFPGGKMVALTLANGGVKWEASVGEPKGATELERVTDVTGVPLMLGSDVCGSAFQGNVACFDVQSGRARWAKKFSSEMGVGGDERFIFAADLDGTVSAFSRDGASTWKNSTLANRRLSAPSSFDRFVVVGDYAGYVHVLSREDGALVARTSIDGSRIAAQPLVAGNRLLIQTSAGTITALSIE